MRTHLPPFGEAEAPLRALANSWLTGTRRTRQVAKRRALTAQDWDEDRINAWETMRLMKEMVQLSYPKSGWRMLLLSLDASDLFGGCCVTQISAAEFDSGMREIWWNIW